MKFVGGICCLTKTFILSSIFLFIKQRGKQLIVLKYKNKPSVIQMQMSDYTLKIRKREFVMSVPKDYRTAMKLLTSVPRTTKKKRGRKKDITKLFYTIDHFVKKGELCAISPKYLRRFRNVAILPESEIIYQGISQVEKLMLKALSGFTGFFEHVIICNNLSFFDDLQENLEAKGISFKNRFLHDIIIFELSRIHIGIDNYTSYMNAIKYFQANYLKTVLHDPNYFPGVSIVSHALRSIPLDALKQFFFELLEETYEFGIIKNRILILGRSIRSF